MLKRFFLLYFIVLTIPLFLGTIAWQSARYSDLERQTRRLEADQEKWVESNKHLIADIATLITSEKVERIAIKDLRLSKIQPENVLQVWIERR
jgi:cell division protein FtsL